MSDDRLDLSTSRPRSLWQRIVDVAMMDVNTIVEGGIDERSIAGLERVLLEADFGVDVTMELVDDLERAAERGKVKNGEDLRRLLGQRIREILREADSPVPSSEAADRPDAAGAATAGASGATGVGGETRATGAGGEKRGTGADRQSDAPGSRGSRGAEGARSRGAEGAGSDSADGGGFSLWHWARERVGAEGSAGGGGAAATAEARPPIERELRRAPEGPTVVLFLGVNGTGKTTTVAKLARRLRDAGESVVVAATDTFRAGAQDQLREWADRVEVAFVGGQEGGDPAAVAFDAVDAALSRELDWVLVDTAGRLHTQRGLMEELRKIDRVLGRKVPGAPHERLLVVDATSGQNVVAQAERFGEALELTGLVLAKFDSTARAGTAVAVARERGTPVRYLGTGEGEEDLEAFDPDVYVEKVLAGPR